MKRNNKELFYNKIAYEWEGRINKSELKKRLKVVFEILVNNVPLKGKKFLDVGCGLGYFSVRAGKLGARVYGIDIGDKLIDICRKKYPKGKFLVASGARLPFKDNSFDVVLCTEVIEHVNSQKKVISEIFRVLKKDGYIIVTTPNKLFQSLYSFLCFVGIRPYHGNEHWFFPWEITQILEKKGKIIKRYYFNFIYPNVFFDLLEKISFLKYLMIHQGYLIIKKTEV